MNRSTITALIKANGGRIINKSARHANYEIPMPEEKFLQLRETIPFVLLWHREEKGKQIFGVFFDQLR